jgi:uncharacterized protein
MRKLFLTLIFIGVAVFARAEKVPQPIGWVNDFAQVLDAGTKDKLNTLITELEEKTTTEIAVVTIASIAPYDEKEYARMLFDQWQPGKKVKDNGVLILLAVKERRWRIETGYGVEGILPDGLCGDIGRTYMVPYFKSGDYSNGLYQGTNAIAAVIAKNAHVNLTGLIDSGEPQEKSSEASPLVFVFMIVIGAFIIIAGYYGGGYSGGFGGSSGGGFGGFGGGGGGGGGAGGGF